MPAINAVAPIRSEQEFLAMERKVLELERKVDFLQRKLNESDGYPKIPQISPSFLSRNDKCTLAPPRVLQIDFIDFPCQKSGLICRRTYLRADLSRRRCCDAFTVTTMTTVSCKIDTAHTDIIHDAQLNYYGNRLATCSSDRLVKVFEVKSNGYIVPIAELAGHSGPVWQVAWAHPDFGGLLASGGYDRRVIIWSDSTGRFQKSHEWTGHEASVNSVAFAPHQLGLILATASADCSIGILEFNAQSAQWVESRILKAHEQGVNAVSWCPVQRTIGDVGEQPLRKRLASCGNDKLVKIWVIDEKGEWIVEKNLAGHSDYVRDVAWCPVISHSMYTIASCGMDQSVILWRCNENNEWTAKLLEKAEGALWHVSWSMCGTILSVSGEDNKITLWKENIQGQWQKMDDNGKA